MQVFKKAGLALTAAIFSIGLMACSPEVGSEKWCEQLQDKSKADWTANEAKDFAKHCLL
ncbi:MAG: DUF3012 domain-containing protein [Methylophaga sp.]|nr:DUF3012 domain-containing protein [Methylophaga sp.]